MHDLLVEFGRSIVDHEVFLLDDGLGVLAEELVQLGAGQPAVGVEVEQQEDGASQHFREGAVEGPQSQGLVEPVEVESVGLQVVDVLVLRQVASTEGRQSDRKRLGEV